MGKGGGTELVTHLWFQDMRREGGGSEAQLWFKEEKSKSPSQFFFSRKGLITGRILLINLVCLQKRYENENIMKELGQMILDLRELQKGRFVTADDGNMTFWHLPNYTISSTSKVTRNLYCLCSG